MVKNDRGILIAFEGGEGSGKTTVMNRIGQRLQKLFPSCLMTREPGATELGEQLRNLVLHSSNPVSLRAETLMFLAARAQACSAHIEPALNRGDIVLSDRFHGSTLAYQGYARGQSLDTIKDLCSYSSGGVWPDLTLFFDIDVQSGLKRTRSSDDNGDRIDQEAESFHENVRDGYIQMTLNNGSQYARINAGASLDEVTEESWRLIRSLLLTYPKYAKDLESKRPHRLNNAQGDIMLP